MGEDKKDDELLKSEFNATLNNLNHTWQWPTIIPISTEVVQSPGKVKTNRLLNILSKFQMTGRHH